MGKKKSSKQNETNEVEVMEINNLGLAKVASINAVDEMYQKYSVDSGQLYVFSCILGKPKYIKGVNRSYYGLHLFYISEGYHKSDVIFRHLNAICDDDIYDEFIVDTTNCDKERNVVYTDVIVTGKFERRPTLTFMVDSISPRVIYNASVRNLSDPYNYDLFNYAIGVCKENKYPDGDFYESKLRSDINTYKNTKQYITQGIKDKISGMNLMVIQEDYIKRVYHGITNFYEPLCLIGDKLKVVLDDIIMMHTGLQNQDQDQMKVLYDVNCLNAMIDVSFAIQALTDIKFTIKDMREAVIIMIVYIKRFYADYVKRLNMDMATAKEYCRYDSTNDTILDSLGFDLNKIDTVYNNIQTFIEYLLIEF